MIIDIGSLKFDFNFYFFGSSKKQRKEEVTPDFEVLEHERLAKDVASELETAGSPLNKLLR